MTGPPAGVTVAVATLNRGESLETCVRSVRRQLTSADELLIVDQTADYLPHIEQRLAAATDGPNIRWVRGGPPSLPAARNYALREAREELVIFVDDDVELLDGFIDAHRAALMRPHVVAVLGRVARPGNETPSDKDPPILQFGGWIKGDANSGRPGQTNSLYGCNMSMWRRVALDVGGFDTGFIGDAFREDADIARRLRARGTIRFDPAAALIHFEATTGGCRPISRTAEIVHFRNEMYFFRRTYHPALLPLWFVSIARRTVFCGPTFRERRVLRSARALFLGAAQGVRRARPVSEEFIPAS